MAMLTRRGASADHPDSKVRERHIRRTYATVRDDFVPDGQHWLRDDQKIKRLIQYLRDPSAAVATVAWATLINLHSVTAFDHRTEVCAEALAISKDETASLEQRMSGIALLIAFGDPAAAPQIRSALEGIDELTVNDDEVVNALERVFNAVEMAPRAVYAPILQGFVAKWVGVGWIEDAPFHDTIDACLDAGG